jgi:hypothetical protein
MKNLEFIKQRMEEILGSKASTNLKMPFIPHIHMSLFVSESIQDRLAAKDYEKLTLIILCHDLIMEYEGFSFPDGVMALLNQYAVDLADLRIVSFKHLRDQMGHNDWSTIVPVYVTRLVDYNNEVCIIHSLICWTNHIIYCVKNNDLAYLDNLGIMCAEFDRQLTANLTTYGYQELIGELLKQYKLQLELAKTAMHPAEASHL